VPSIGLFLIVVWGVADLVPRTGTARRVTQVGVSCLAAAVLLTLTLLTRNQVAFWHDSVTLWEHSLAVTPDNFLARTNLGWAYQESGQLAKAERQFVAAVELRPDLPAAQLNLGRCFARQGRMADAEACFRKAAELRGEE
jgi:Flp pilus assembly protein TadD